MDWARSRKLVILPIGKLLIIAGMVDLARFVCGAVQLDGGDVRERPGDTVLEVRLPPAWCHGLDEVPGYDADSRTARLTTDLEVIRDEHDWSVGYLGRAHPLVRRALDRVRHLSFGGAAERLPRGGAARTPSAPRGAGSLPNC